MEELRVVKLRRSVGEDFGFAIRGGYEHKVGFFVSHIRPGSRAELCGLQIGDQILRVGGYCVERCVIDDFIHLLSFKETVILRVKNCDRLPVKSHMENGLSWHNVRAWSPDCLQYANNLVAPSKHPEFVPPEPDYPPPMISDLITPLPTPRHSLLQKQNSLKIEEITDEPTIQVELGVKLVEKENPQHVSHSETVSNLPIVAVGKETNKILRKSPDTVKSGHTDMNSDALAIAHRKLREELEEKLKIQRNKAENQANFEELEIDSFDRKPYHSTNKEFHSNGFSRSYDGPTDKQVIHQSNTDEGYFEPTVQKSEFESKGFAGLSVISNALDEMYSTLDPRLMFTDSQLRGRTVQVVSVATDEVPELLIMREGNPFIRCDGTYLSSEILMMEGRSLAGYSFGEICDMISGFPRKSITLVVASDDL